MTEVFDSITHRQKILFTTLLLLGVIVVVFKMIIYPVCETNTQLKHQLENQQQLSQYLHASKKSLAHNKIFPTLKPTQSQNIVDSAFKNIEKNTTIAGDKITLTASSQSFNKIVNSIRNLKVNNGIVVLQATITKTKEGLVDATLEFGYPL